MEAMTRKLMEEFAGNYFEKLLYFCLKKTGDSQEAEELAADITLNVVSALQKGTIPHSFSGWVWQIARNRYSAWADSRRRSREFYAGTDIGEMELADEKTNLEEAWLHNEDLKLLRRELSFIASDYRSIVVAYYIQNRSIKDIGRMLGLPDGTVKSKLFRARDMLKEGMSMAREFGAMSYKPENVKFNCCCNTFGEYGEPWNYLNRILCRNILLAAYRIPSTAEELAVEVGVALPYMDDELRQLTESTLLIKNGKKYETSFYIMSSRMQEKVYSHLKGLTHELTEAIIEAVEYRVRCLEKNGARWHEGYQPYEDMKWTLLMQETGILQDRVTRDFHFSRHTLRPNGGEWDVVGYEECESAPQGVGDHGGCMLNGNIDQKGYKKLLDDGIQFEQYRFEYQNIYLDTPDWLSYEEISALGKLARKEKNGLSEEILTRLLELGYVRKNLQGYEPAIMVTRADTKPLTEEQTAEYERLREKAKEIAVLHCEFVRKCVMEDIPDFLKENLHQINFAIESVSMLRGGVLEEAVRRGYLTYNKDQGRRMLGAFMTIRL